jgi:hypothetical protein
VDPPGSPSVEDVVDLEGILINECLDRQVDPSIDGCLGVHENLIPNGDASVEDDEPLGVAGTVGDESVGGGEPDSSAYAMPVVLAVANPTPRATARAPTRPMCLA